MFDEIIQQRYYDETASTYDNNCGHSPEHEFALYLLLGFLESIKADSVLDVGCGTGRGLAFLKQHRPNMILRGCEPVKALRDVGIKDGIPGDWLIEANGYALPFPNGSFDVVMEFGVLHHVKHPRMVVREMLRVAKYGIILSDSNNLGMGGLYGRIIKGAFYWLGLWNLLSLIRTRGRGYVYEPNDGLWYYYTVLSHFRELKRLCQSVHVINTRRSSRTHWLCASHAVVMATKGAIVARNALFDHLG